MWKSFSVRIQKIFHVVNLTMKLMQFWLLIMKGTVREIHPLRKLRLKIMKITKENVNKNLLSFVSLNNMLVLCFKQACLYSKCWMRNDKACNKYSKKWTVFLRWNQFDQEKLKKNSKISWDNWIQLFNRLSIPHSLLVLFR